MSDSGRGRVVVLSGPSGGGKTSVCRKLLERRDDARFSVSATTRTPRQGEVDGVSYRFVDRQTFESMVRDDELLEWAEVHGHLYGTPRDQLDECRQADEVLLLDVDVQGARQIRARVPEAVLVFLLPPDAITMLDRLRGRGSESGETLRRRLETALLEFEAIAEFDFGVVNADLDDTADAVAAIIEADRLRIARPASDFVRRGAELAEAVRVVLETNRSRVTG